MNTTFSIVSDNTLSKFVCANCYNYSSVGPIGVVGDKLICGRCPHENATLTLDDSDMSTKLFPCVNRFDGCKKLLVYSDVIRHEQKCLDETNTSYCYLCPYSGNLCQLYNHLKEYHGVKDHLFSFKLDFRKTSSKLFRLNDFLIVIRSEPRETEMIFKVMIYGRRNVKNPLRYQIKLKDPNRFQKMFKCPERVCSVGNRLVDDHSSEDCFVRYTLLQKILHTDSLKNIICEVDFTEQTNIPSYFELRDLPALRAADKLVDSATQTNETETLEDSSSRSRRIMGSPKHVHRDTDRYNINFSDLAATHQSKLEPHDASTQTDSLPTPRRKYVPRMYKNLVNSKGTFIDKIKEKFFKCCSCEAFVCSNIYQCQAEHIKCEECTSDFCKKCNDISNCQLVTDGRDLILTEFNLPCRFNKLHLYEPKLLRDHEFRCSDRVYSCPLLCGWKGTLKELKEHWHSENTPLVEDSCEIDCFQEGNQVFYVFYKSDCFLCRIQRNGSNQKQIHIRHIFALSASVSKTSAILKLNILSSKEKYETVSSKIVRLGEIETFDVPVRQYYKIKIDFVN